jgi:hypothetical protein
METELIRDALQSPDQRERLARALAAAKRPARRRLWMSLAAAGTLGAVALAVALLTEPGGRPTTGSGGQLIPASPTQSAAGPADLSDLFRLPAQRNQPVEVSLDRGGLLPRYRVGETWRLEVRPAEESEVYIFERGQDGSIQTLFPTGDGPGSRVSPGRQIRLEHVVREPIGRRQVRVLVLPPGATLPAGEAAESRFTVADQEYEVTAP